MMVIEEQQTKTEVGVLVIGQTPRHDLVNPLQETIPNARLVIEGALDGLQSDDLPAHQSTYPLMTRMRSGDVVIVEESFLEGRLQAAVQRLEVAGVEAIILLCAGTFETVRSKLPLIKPFDVGRELFAQHRYSSLGFITPVADQIKPIQSRWVNGGVRPAVWCASLDKLDQAFQKELQLYIEKEALEAVVLDYVGHPREQVDQLRKLSPIPVFDLGQLAIEMVVAYIKGKK